MFFCFSAHISAMGGGSRCLHRGGSVCEGFGNGVGRGTNLPEASFKYISWLEMMKSKAEMIKSRFAISNSSHENVLYRLSGCLSMMTEQSLIKTTLHRLREVSTARFVPNLRVWGEITENKCCLYFIYKQYYVLMIKRFLLSLQYFKKIETLNEKSTKVRRSNTKIKVKGNDFPRRRKGQGDIT